MPLKLSRVSDDVAVSNIEFNKGRVDKLRNEPEGSKARSVPVRYARNLGNASFNVAADLYQQQREDGETRRYLGLAADGLVDGIVLRTPPASEAWQPTEYEKALALAFCFGTPETMKRALGATNEQIFSQPDAKNAALFEPSFQYVTIARDYLRSGSLDLAAVDKTMALCNRDSAWKFDRLVTMNKLKALRAINEKEEQSFNESLTILVEDHKNEALHGELQKLPDANLAVPVLLLAKLGQQAGLQCTVDSPYLPLQLMV